MGQVLVAYADADAELGARIATALAEAGLAVTSSVGAPSLKADKERFDKAAALVLVWSRHAAAEPGLRREAVEAAARGKLTVARADGVQHPTALRAAKSFPVTRANAVNGPRTLARTVATALASSPTSKPAKGPRRMNATPAMDVDTTNYRSTWKGTLLLAVLLAGVAYGTLYVVLGKSPAPFLMGLLP
jgi:hypothetical protein